MKFKSIPSIYRVAIAFIGLCMCFLTTTAASDACIYGDCQNGLSLKKRSSGVMYVGVYEKGRLNGAGRFIDKDGDQCTGRWLDGRMSGETFCRYTDGSIYAGEYYLGKKDGYGIRIAADGRIIREGLWEAGKFVVDMATEIGKDKDLLRRTLSTQFSECLVGDCLNGWGIKLGFGGALQKGNWRNSRFLGDEAGRSTRQPVASKKEAPTSVARETQQYKKLSQEQFRMAIAKKYPELFAILKEDRFKAFIKTDTNINSIFKVAFKSQDLDGIGSLMNLYKKYIADGSATKAVSSNSIQSKIASGNQDAVSSEIVFVDESRLGIPVQYRTARDSYDDWGVWIFIFLAVPIIGWMIFTYRAR